MTGSTHVALALSATLGAKWLSDYQPDTAGWICVILGSLAPDIDAGGATISRPGSLARKLIPNWLCKFADGIGLFISRKVRKVFGHRNFFHWPILACIMIYGGFYYGVEPLAWFGWGYFWHIIGDFCTVRGAPMLSPLWLRDISWSPIRTGSKEEHLIEVVLWTMILILFVLSVPLETREWLTQQGASLWSMTVDVWHKAQKLI